MSITVRKLKVEDLSNGFFETLSNLSEVGKIKDEIDLAKEIFNRINKEENYKIIVAEDKATNQIIGTATLLIEQKFIHSGGKAGHIEDVVTRHGYEGKGIGRRIIEELIKIAKESKCYKVTLDCDEKVVGFYEKLGFKKHQIMMRINT